MTPEERAETALATLDAQHREMRDQGVPFTKRNLPDLESVVAAAIRAAVAEERERCARIVEETAADAWESDTVEDWAGTIAAAIRSVDSPQQAG